MGDSLWAAVLLDSAPIHSDQPDPDGDKDLRNWSSLIGIVTAIVGNVLIALALNVQRYAHIRLHREHTQVRRRAKEALRQGQNGAYGTLNTNNGPRNGTERSITHDTFESSDNSRDSDPLMPSLRSEDSADSECSADEMETSSTYLKSPYWWMGQILITLGELGNFLAYGFAPASIVSPLGVVALISNCIIAPILFKEIFRQRDFWGVVIAVGGVVTVVLSANQEETKLDPHDVWLHITTIEFEVYLAVTISLIAVLMWASSRYGTRTILIDLGLVGLFGGYTALSTKGVSSMLSSTFFRAFTTPVTYALIFILLLTAVMQIRYVNKALQRFGSTQVIPIQFVTFTLSVIIGSAVLYRDFERTTPKQATKFVGGCLLTFFGVFLITSGRPEHSDEEDRLSDIHGVEETIGLARQESNPPNIPSTALGEQQNSRRSSKALLADARHLGTSYDVGSATERSEFNFSGSPRSQESAPLLSNPWANSLADDEVLLPPGVRTISDDSISTPRGPTATQSVPSTPLREEQPPPLYPAESPLTPRTTLGLPVQPQRTQSHHYGAHLFSPSPLSSTVNAVVKDTLLREREGPLLKRPSVRRLRSSIRASLFMSEDQFQHERSMVAQEEHEGRRPTARSQDFLGEMPQESSREAQVGSLDGIRRPRSLSDTLGELFKGKRRARTIRDETDEAGTGPPV